MEFYIVDDERLLENKIPFVVLAVVVKRTLLGVPLTRCTTAAEGVSPAPSCALIIVLGVWAECPYGGGKGGGWRGVGVLDNIGHCERLVDAGGKGGRAHHRCVPWDRSQPVWH